MMVSLVLYAALLLFASASQALPTYDASIISRAPEPAWSVPVKTMQQAITCSQSMVKPNPVLIVPGTGETASKFFPKNLGALFTENGYNVCYLNTPADSLGDMQITSEYVAFAIQYIEHSSAGKIRVIAHSQGCTNVQWALTFWPSLRAKVHSFIALGPAWKGTAIGPLINNVHKDIAGSEVAAVTQQASGSKFLAALQKHGGEKMLVPTTTVMTNTDEIVLPYNSGQMAGAVNIIVQNFCKQATDHFLLVTNPVSQFVALEAFKSDKGVADTSIMKAKKEKICAGDFPGFKGLKAAPVSFTLGMVQSVITTVVTGNLKKDTLVKEEPPLQKYAQ